MPLRKLVMPGRMSMQLQIQPYVYFSSLAFKVKSGAGMIDERIQDNTAMNGVS